ncbi:unnamed protein product [Ectocarpus sp. 12 AP-2014]
MARRAGQREVEKSHCPTRATAKKTKAMKGHTTIRSISRMASRSLRKARHKGEIPPTGPHGRQCEEAGEPVMNEYDKAGASTYARQEIVAKIAATAVLVRGRESFRFLEDLAAQPTNNDGKGDVCCQASTEVFDRTKTMIKPYLVPRVLQSFYRLAVHVERDAVVNVQCTKHARSTTS